VTDVNLLITLKIHCVTADYVPQIRDAGLDPNVDEAFALKIHAPRRSSSVKRTPMA